MLWLKALHIIAVISWMAGLLYLPRLFVYHAEAKPDSETSNRFKIMELRLLRTIMGPAMIAVWITGPPLAWVQGVYFEGWFLAKMVLVSILTWYHHILARWRKDFATDRNQRSARFYRMANELPTILMAAIVLLVVVKPF